jgi:hypothetical protein
VGLTSPTENASCPVVREQKRGEYQGDQEKQTAYLPLFQSKSRFLEKRSYKDSKENPKGNDPKQGNTIRRVSHSLQALRSMVKQVTYATPAPRLFAILMFADEAVTVTETGPPVRWSPELNLLKSPVQ